MCEACFIGRNHHVGAAEAQGECFHAPPEGSKTAGRTWQRYEVTPSLRYVNDTQHCMN